MITGGQEEEDIVISLRDNGIGIPMDFDWRHTLSLGMHLIMTLVEQVNGTIELTDRNEGTHFTIRIPRDSRIGGR
jgi:two-component sensor histidine kinase